jgi:ribosomal silencing factor RsfS
MHMNRWIFYDLMNIYINFVIFRTRAKRRKIFSLENIFRKNDFREKNLRRKSFYVERNEA